MTSHAYFRALAAQAPPLNDAMRPVRVRLLFLDEVGAFVQRQRGYSSCWYLVPRTAKLVGDMLHDVMEEFELLKRCPHGVELLLEGFHVMANQEIDVIRDHDTLAVQCASELGSVLATSRSESISSKTKQTAGSKRALQQAPLPEKCKRKKHEESKSSSGGADSNLERVGDGRVKAKTARGEGREGTRSRTTLQKLFGSNSSSSSSSSSSESDDESDTDSDSSSGSVKTKQRDALRTAVKETVKIMKESNPVVTTSTSDSSSSSSESSNDDSSDGSSDESDGGKAAAPTKVSGKASASATRTRRRRRQRRRPKPADKADSSSAVVATKKPASACQAPEPSAQTAPDRDIRPLRIRGVQPSQAQRGANHVRFDRPLQSQHGRLPTSAPAAKDLQKYGPRSVPPQEKQPPGTSERDQAPRTDSSQSKKKPPKEMWKRPYEIVASILDTTSDSSGSNKLSLESLVSKFPAKPTDSSLLPVPSGLQVKDVVAYKTLTLCMETWQPIVSEWKCGQVVALDDQTTQLQPLEWILPSSANDPLSWKAPSEDAEAVEVALGELSELRYVDGPTKLHLEKI